ncbi:MAG: ABC transporter permease subunit [Chloroflexota bacterium]
MMNDKATASIWKSLRLGLFILVGLVIYAYGFQVTKVDLAEFRKESRQESRIRVTRALARPDILEYEQEEVTVFAPVYVPCPSQLAPAPAPDNSAPYIVLTPNCGKPNETVQVEGFNFQPYLKGPLYFVPSTDPQATLALQKGNIETDGNGHFVTTFKLPDRPSESAQYVRVITRRNVGRPHFSQTAIETWDKIIETIFLAFLATTIGTIFSIPISFFAARNLMKDVKSPLTSIALSVIGWPIGIGVGWFAARWIGAFANGWRDNSGVSLLFAILSALVGVFVLRWAVFQPEGERPSRQMQALQGIGQVVAVLAWILFFFLLSQLGIAAGASLSLRLGKLAFLGNFLRQLSDVFLVILPAVLSVSGGAVTGNMLGRFGARLNDRLPLSAVKMVNIFLSALAGGTLLLILAGGVSWLYEINDPWRARYFPLIAGVILGALLALLTKAKEPLPVGLAIYTTTRTILNAVRSIEALIMAIVAVIWVGIGPFAGVLALGLHTIASLAKLYSEQVESILPGPLEAITATGATRLQTIIYAVIPQIIPPYISFTMYRWDINVRMSTIIGFAGGGGIGFLLIQNINLLNYRAASTQMLAIAIVVAAMDYFSSAMREKFV